MTREEKRREASIDYQLSTRPITIGGDTFADDIRQLNVNPSFIKGAEWADIEVGRELYGAHHGKWYCRYTTGNYQYKTIADNLVDTCYETILKLHEKKLI